MWPWRHPHPDSPFAPIAVAFALIASPTVAPAASVDRCAECHKGLTNTELAVPATVSSSDVHGKARIPCVTCHGGNPGATKGNQAHVDGFVARPKGAQAAEICGRCHTPELQNWSRSPHATAPAMERRADCVTCHGAHGVKPASLAIIAEPLCSSCHSIDRARRIWKAVVEVEDQAGSLERDLRGKDGELSDLLVQVQHARSDLRGLSHSLDLIGITRQAADAQETLEKAQVTAAPRLGALRWGTILRWFAIGVGALVLMALGFFVGRFLWRRLAKPLVDRTLERHGTTPFKVLGGFGVVLAIAFAIIGFRGYRYIQHSPDFCTSCHLMDTAFQTWEHSGHKNIECHACHESDVVGNMRQLWIYATRRPTEVIRHAYVEKNVCETCHNAQKSPAKWNQVLSTNGHQVHVVKEKVECVQCHGASLHRFVPTSQTCSNCHAAETLSAAGGMAAMHCTQCHAFLADGGKSLAPTAAMCIECHGAEATAEQREGHAKHALYQPGEKGAGMQWACGKCHKPHRALKPSSADCAGCHKEVLTDFPAHEVKQHQGRTECIDCHPPHGWKPDGTCQRCHGDKVPKLPE